MKRIFSSVLLQFLFWMLTFALSRLVFILFYHEMMGAEHITFIEKLSVFYHALKLDFATASYLMIIPVFLLIIQLILKFKIFKTINKAYTIIMVLLYALISAGEIGLYGEWKIKLNVKALHYLQNPSEVINSAENSSIVILSLFVIIFTVGLYWVYNRFFFVSIVPSGKLRWLNAAILLILSPLLVLGMRGGVQQIPINQSEVYFSKKLILNHAATNNAFNLYISVIENYKNLEKNPYGFYPTDEAEKTVAEIYHQKSDSTIKILNTKKPNIVLFLMESWSADLIESLGGEPGITPEFHELEKEGILFDNVLSSGSRSEQAMASVFAGFPAHPITSITVQPDKHPNLPSLIHRLNGAGYNTSFYFGGQLIYGNIRSFIYYNAFDKVMEGDDFKDDNIIRGKLGVHDEFTMGKLLQDLNKEKEPFFAALFTLSSHSPYDQPMEDIFDWGKNENSYINSAFYSDRSLGDFFKKAKTELWYENTLFIVVADHSHNSYRNWPFHTGEYHKVPMLWLGGALDSAYRGTRWHKPASQVDIPATLLAQINMESDDFHWSKNLFDPFAPEFKYFGFDNGLIWIEPGGSFSYDTDLESYYWARPGNNPPTNIERRGKSFLQVLYQEYLNY